MSPGPRQRAARERAQQLGQRRQRQRAVVQHHRGAPLEHADIVGRHLHDPLDRVQRHHIGAVAGAQQQPVRSGQGERQGDGEDTAQPRGALDAHAPVHALDARSDDIEPNAAPRQRADRLARREACEKDQLGQLRLALVREVGLAGQPVRQRPPPDRRQVEAGAVVGDRQRQVIAAGLGAQRDPPLAGLAVGLADIGRLDTMVDRIAQQVQQNLAKPVEHLAIGLGAGVVEVEHNLLAGGAGHLAQLEPQRAEDRGQRQHARAADLLVQAVADGMEAPVVVAQLVRKQRQASLELADQRVGLLERLDQHRRVVVAAGGGHERLQLVAAIEVVDGRPDAPAGAPGAGAGWGAPGARSAASARGAEPARAPCGPAAARRPCRSPARRPRSAGCRAPRSRAARSSCWPPWAARRRLRHAGRSGSLAGSAAWPLRCGHVRRPSGACPVGDRPLVRCAAPDAALLATASAAGPRRAWRRLRRGVVQQRVEHGQQRLIGCEVGRLTGGDLIHQHADGIQRGIDRVAQVRRDLAMALADAAEHLLDAMRELLDLGQAGGPRAALEAMRLAEEPIEQRPPLRVLGLALEGQQQLGGCLGGARPAPRGTPRAPGPLVRCRLASLSSVEAV